METAKQYVGFNSPDMPNFTQAKNGGCALTGVPTSPSTVAEECLSKLNSLGERALFLPLEFNDRLHNFSREAQPRECDGSAQQTYPPYFAEIRHRCERIEAALDSFQDLLNRLAL